MISEYGLLVSRLRLCRHDHEISKTDPGSADQADNKSTMASLHLSTPSETLEEYDAVADNIRSVGDNSS